MSFLKDEFRQYLFEKKITNVPGNYAYYLNCIENWFQCDIDAEYDKDKTESLHNKILEYAKTPEVLGKKNIDLRNASSKLNHYCKFREWFSTQQTKKEHKVNASKITGENDIVAAFQHIADTDEKCATEVMYALTLLETNIENMVESIKEQTMSLVKNNRFEDAERLTKYGGNITKIADQVGKCIDVLINNSEDDTLSIPPEEFSSGKIDYSKYAVDNTEVHFLNEDYTHKRIDAFIFEDVKYSVDSWKDALNLLCALLFKKDWRKFESLVDDPDFIGRIHYFSRTHVPERNERIAGTNFFVWVNLPANIVVQIIRKCLRKYNIPFNNFGILLRADFSSLHRGA